MDDLIPVVHFDTAEFPPDAKLAAWAGILPWFEIGRLEEAGEFDVVADAWLVDGMVVSVTRMPPVWLQRGAALIAADRRADYAVVVANAPWRLKLGSSTVSLVEPGAVCVLDNSQSFTVETAAGEYLILNVPRAMLSQSGLPPDLHGSLVRHTLAMVFGDFIKGLRTRLPSLTQGQAPAVARAMRDLLAACVTAGAEPCRAADDRGSVVQRAGWYVDNNLAMALTVNDIARAMGVSRSSLYRIFSEAGGVERFVMRRRLGRARAMLTHGLGERRSVAEVALATGFASTTHFSRVFKAEFGVAPSVVRTQAPPPLSSMTADQISRFRSWFEAPGG